MLSAIRFSRIVFSLCAVLALFAHAVYAERVEQLRPTNYLSDFAGVVDASTTQRINELGIEVQQKTGAQIAVVTVRTLEGAEASDFANRLFKQWGVGQNNTDRGVLILLATEDHKYWTEVGYGLEPILPDGKVGGFGREMVPLLRENRYSDAILLITGRIAQTIADDAHVTLSAQTQTPEPTAETPSQPAGPHVSLSLILVILFVVFFILPGILGRGRRGSGCSGCLFPLFLGGFGGGGYGGGGWGGGGFGGGSSGGGFGGFGGGSSGGGGAGGSW
jgi:uncharacterized protein